MFPIEAQEDIVAALPSHLVQFEPNLPSRSFASLSGSDPPAGEYAVSTFEIDQAREALRRAAITV